MAHATTWDSTLPVGTESVATGDNRIRELKLSIIDRMNLEHWASDGAETNDVDCWKHRKASGRCNYGLSGAIPTATAPLDGALYYETDTELLKRCNGSAWVLLGLAKAQEQYKAGYVKVDTSSATVDGSGTSFITGGVSTNDMFIGPDSNSYKITARTATQLTITPVYEGATTTSSTYLIEFKRSDMYLPKYGGNMNGAINMGNTQIRNVAAATSDGDVLTYGASSAQSVQYDTYTGNGVSDSTLSGFKANPLEIIIYRISTATPRVTHWFKGIAATYCWAFDGATWSYGTALIKSVTSNQAVLSASTSVNGNGSSYVFLAYYGDSCTLTLT